ncbi:beta-aspartyl-peptidase [Clostridium amazonitimonense]|uniref:beta-aspartyl-peptidase n=1 Tax=Clostridium amazonitimonense TaxID=1499689 RepID=UPI000509A250|nr:beta-aspartyl-peptidase [Clostridium amazonitimonense]
MITIIKNIEVYAPEYLGKKDIVLAGDSIEDIKDNIEIPKEFLDIKVIDGSGKILFPGFIDAHVHLIGGGGEGGFKTRTPEIQLSELIEGGITTVIGCLGTDGVCRDMRALLAKAKGLEEEGITTFIYTGSYEIPVKTITGNIKEDIMLIDKIIGVGEVALSDHRSSQPTYEEFIRLSSHARVAGILSGKAGIVHIHLGDGERGMSYLEKVIKDTEIPIKQFVPTHVNRSIRLFNEAVKFAEKGGYVDITTSSDPNFLEKDEVKASKGLKMFLERGIPVEQITLSSDAQGSLPIFNERRELVGLGVGSVKTLYREVRDAITEDGIKIEDAIKTITSNVADALKLNKKGRVAKAMDADLVMVNSSDLNISNVIYKGREVFSEGKLLLKGTFEKQ